jgi:hypothetical protein
MSKLLLSALKAKYEAEKAEAMANIESSMNSGNVSFDSIVLTYDRYIDDFVKADQKLNALSKIFTIKEENTDIPS